MMIYIITLGLLIASHILGSYFAVQGLRPPIDKPLIYSNENLVLILSIITGWVPFLYSLYLGYNSVGIYYALLLFLLKVLILPSLFDVKKMMDKIGI